MKLLALAAYSIDASEKLDLHLLSEHFLEGFLLLELVGIFLCVRGLRKLV